MSHGFYRAFEERMRGSREVITERLRGYQPLLEQLVATFGTVRAVDIGCGRGEWLGLLRDAGLDGHGVDLDEGMLAACREQGLSVEQADGIDWLSKCDDESLTLVTAFHVAEHLPFEQLQALVKEARRVLQPGGILLLEAPNPENLSVGAHTFYIDPTHEKPLPATLVEFLTLHYGFVRSSVWRLQETPELRSKINPGLSEVLLGVSPDYAVVAQSPADSDILTSWDELFSRHPGVALSQLAGRFDDSLQSKWAHLERQEALLLRQEETLQRLEEALQYLLRQRELDTAALSTRLDHVDRVIRPWALLRKGLGMPWRAGGKLLRTLRRRQ